MKRPAAILVFSLCALALSPIRSVNGADAGAIVPGQSLGPIRLGMPVRGVQQLAGWGQPDRTHSAGSIIYASYDRPGVTVAGRDEQVVLILTTSERYRTDKGLAVGQGLAAATTAYGAAAAGGDNRTHWFDGIGLVVQIGSGTITRIGVYDPKTFVRAILADELPARDVFLSAGRPKVEEARRAAASGATPRLPAQSGAPAIARPGVQSGTQSKEDKAALAGRAIAITITLKNASRASKVLNPNFFTLIDREGARHRYDRSTFSHAGACKSTVSVKAGEAASCTLVFVLPPGRQARSIVYNDGGSIDEFFF